ncbi:MAG: PE domain-containing protein [Pseudonocardiaceae bacterium]
MAGGFDQAGAQAADAGAGWSAIGDSFARADAQLVGINGQQTDLQRAVLAGELWLDPDVAESAAKRCDQAVEEITKSLDNADRLTWARRFGDNEDGWAVAERFAQAGREYVAMLEKAQEVVKNMAATYRAAARTVAQADAAGEQMLRGRPE